MLGRVAYHRLCAGYSFPARWLILMAGVLVCSCGREDGENDAGLLPIVAVGSQWYGHVPV
jgi:hypothetical protein